MKKLLLTIAAFICLASSAHSQILNGGFENWTAGLPDNWWGVVFPPYDLLSQTTTAHSGTYAVKLHIDTLAGQPFGTPLSTGNGTVTTHPLTFVPLSFSFWYKLNAMNGDELTATALVYSGGSGSGVAAFSEPAAANYTYVNMPIQYGTIPPNADSIALVFIITNTAGSPNIGSDAFIDDVAVSASTGINNQNADNSFSIIPNPADHFVSVELTSAANKSSEIIITDLTGRLVYDHLLSGTEKKFTIATNGLKQGVYYCTIKSGDVVNRKPLVIIHE